MLKISQQSVMARPKDLLFGPFKQSKQSLQKFLPTNKPIWTWASSARHAIYLTLKQIQRTNSKKFNSKPIKTQNATGSQRKLTVAIPAFTCQVVKESAQDADFNIQYYDSNHITTVQDIQNTIKNAKQTNQPIDVLILCYNFGNLPNDIQQIKLLCQKNNIILIEDCAQALGAIQKQNNQNVVAGSWGDFAIYSFGISKNIAMAGGLILSSKSIDKELTQSLPNMPIKEWAKAIFEASSAAIILSPLLFPITSKLLSKRVHKVNRYPNKQYTLPSFFQNVILHQANRYKSVLNKRQQNKQMLTKQNTIDACLYYTIIPNSTKEKEDIIKNAEKNNIQLTNLKSFIFLPNQTKANKQRFPKAHIAHQNHLAIALFKSKNQIQKIKHMLNKQ